MGVDKTLSNYCNQGTDIGYWNIYQVIIDKDGSATALLHGYSSKVNKTAGEGPRCKADITFDGDDFPLDLATQEIDGNNVYKICYAKMAETYEDETKSTGVINVRQHAANFDLQNGTPNV